MIIITRDWKTYYLSIYEQSHNNNNNNNNKEYQLLLVRLEGVLNAWEKDWRNWQSEEESRPHRTLHKYDRLKYSGESWKSEETCCHSDSSISWPEKLSRSKMITI